MCTEKGGALTHHHTMNLDPPQDASFPFECSMIFHGKKQEREKLCLPFVIAFIMLLGSAVGYDRIGI